MCNLKVGQPVFYRYHAVRSQLGVVEYLANDPRRPVLVQWHDPALALRNPMPYKGSIGLAILDKEH